MCVRPVVYFADMNPVEL